MATQSTRVASWYWIISAILTPFLLLATVGWFYYASRSQNLRAEAERLAAQARADATSFDTTIAHMKELAAATGFELGDPVAKHQAAEQPRATLPAGNAEQEAKIKEDRNAVYNVVRDAEKEFYGTDDKSTGNVHKYLSARRWLGDFRTAVDRYIALKSYQYYTVRSLAPAADGSGDLARALEQNDKGMYVPPAAALDAAAGRRGTGPVPNEPPAEKFLQAPTAITMELVFGMQFQLIGDLLSANRHEYGLLYGEVAGDIDREKGIGVGFTGEEMRLAAVRQKFSALATLIGNRGREASGRLAGVSSATVNSADMTQTETRKLTDRVGRADSRIEELANSFESERATHQTDAEAFERLTRNIPRIKIPIKIEKRQPDGQIMYSDYGRRVVHIDLGSADGVRVGQRFEVWRFSGRDPDLTIGVIEIVRTLNDHFSLATVLSLVDEKKPINKSDKIISRIWDGGRFLTVALHGAFEPPAQAYSKDRLSALLQQAGCRIVEKVQPGTDLVITGSNLLGDDWYRKAKDDLRFEALREEDVRIYVDPR